MQKALNSLPSGKEGWGWGWKWGGWGWGDWWRGAEAGGGERNKQMNKYKKPETNIFHSHLSLCTRNNAKKGEFLFHPCAM